MCSNPLWDFFMLFQIILQVIADMLHVIHILLSYENSIDTWEDEEDNATHGRSLHFHSYPLRHITEHTWCVRTYVRTYVDVFAFISPLSFSLVYWITMRKTASKRPSWPSYCCCCCCSICMSAVVHIDRCIRRRMAIRAIFLTCVTSSFLGILLPAKILSAFLCTVCSQNTQAIIDCLTNNITRDYRYNETII